MSNESRLLDGRTPGLPGRDGGDHLCGQDERGESITFVVRTDGAKKGAESFAPDGSWRTTGHMISVRCARWVAHRSFAVEGGERHKYFSETPDLPWVKAVTPGNNVAAVFVVRRAYFYTEVRGTRSFELLDFVPANVLGTWESGVRHCVGLGQLHQLCGLCGCRGTVLLP